MLPGAVLDEQDVPVEDKSEERFEEYEIEEEPVVLPRPESRVSSSGSGGARPMVVVPGAEVVEPPEEPPELPPEELEVEVAPEERPVGRRRSQPSVHESLSDWWEPMPSQKAWVRYHTRDRHGLFVCTSRGQGWASSRHTVKTEIHFCDL